MKTVSGRRLGVTVMPEYLQSEGIDCVLHNIADRLGGTSVTTSPYVATQCGPGKGFREPPEDAGAGKKRLLERPLWGKREVYMETAPSFVPDLSLYDKTSYAPETPTALTHTNGVLIGQFISAAKTKGLKTYLQIMAASPPSLRVQVGHPHAQDQPMLPNGQPVPDRVDRNASLASADMREYMRALITDLCRNYPDCDGFKFDWPEYPPYHFTSLFADYNPQVAAYANEIGIDLTALANGMVKDCLNSEGILRHWEYMKSKSFAEAMNYMRSSSQTFDDHFRLRTHLVESYASFLRECVDEASGGSKTVFLQGFPPPWNTLSGFNSTNLKHHAHELAIKFYTMHWPMMGANYVEHGHKKFGVPRSDIANFFSKNFMGHEEIGKDHNFLKYPEPDMAHGISTEKILSTFKAFGHDDAVGITHSYGPCDDVVLRCAALIEATNHNIEINRYAYLSEEKIDAISQLVNSCSETSYES